MARGRPRIFPAKSGAGYITVKLRKDQLRFIDRVAGPAGGQKGVGLRKILDAGMKAMGRRRAGRA